MSILHVALAVLVGLCWGGNFAASKFALLHFPPFLMVFIRFAVVALILLPFAQRLPLKWKELVALSLMMITLHFCLVFTAMWMGLSIGSTAIAIQLGAPFSCALGAIFLNEKMGPWRTFGMMIAFVGIIIIAGTPDAAQQPIAFMCALIGAFFWAATNVYMKSLGNHPVMSMLFWTALLSLPQLALISAVIETNHWELVLTAPYSAWFGLGFTCIASTLIGYGTWYWLIKTYDVTHVAPYSLLAPISGFASGIIFFDEPLTIRIIIGGLITIAGVAVITIRRPKHAQMGR